MKLQSIPDVLTLFDVVHYRASEASGTADASAFTYMDDGDHVSGTLSFAELDLAARKLAARLQRITKPGDRVLLVYSPSLDYIIAFYGCVYAGVTAVPALPPANRRTLPRLRLMAADSQPVAALTLARIRDSVMNVDAGDSGDDVLRQIPWLSTDDIDGDESTWVRPEVQASDIVFLQYTSGSTGTPKGVMVAHHNLLANLRLFRQMFDVRVGETFVFWLPPHHDFGLIGSIIMPVFAGAHCVQFPPAAFMMSPVRWLRLISRYRARLTGAPNFAYQLCVDKISEAQMQGLDLSCLDVAMNGAERIRFETVTQFTEKFATCGFRRESMMPSYGMAEFVLLATADMHRAIGTFPNTACISKAALEGGLILPAERSHDAVHIVSVGRTHEELHALAIVDPVTLKRKGDQQVGEVWLCGPSVSHGYWRQDAAARQQTFCARMAGDEREWLRTGDVGFVSKEELFITGRSKEVMIFSGRNIYPQDVEITVERASPAFRANGCSAFSLEDGNTTQLVVVQEVESRRRLETEGLIARLRADIAEQHEIFSLAAVILVRPGHVPRTSSGKIQRVRCRQMYLAGEFDSIWSWCSEKEDLPAEDPAQLRTSTELRLLELWRGVFGNQALLVSDNFFHLGGHSLLAAQLVAAVGAEFHVDLPLRALFEAPSVASLASLVDTFQPRETAADELLSSPQGGDLPLSFAQQRFWFLDHYQPANAFYAVPVAMRLSGKLVLPALWQALDAMVQRHAVLRTIFPVTDGVPSQRVLPSLAWPLLISDVGDLDADGVDASIRHAMMEETRKPFDLARGPLIRAHLLHIGTEQHVLLLTLHHIVHDGWSVGVLIDELAQAYAATKEDQKLVLPALPVSYADYTQWERRRYDKQNIRIHLSYWIERLRGASPLLALPTDRPRPTLMSHRGATHVTSLSGDLVRRLAERAGQHNATLFMALTAGIQILLHRYCGQDDICMSVLSANRPAKTESMIGVFVNVVPLRAQFSAGQVFADALAATRQEVLSAYERQLPFELIINQLVRERHAAYTPYAQVVLNFHSELERRSGMQQHWIEQSLQFDGRWAAGVAYTAFDLLLDVRESHGGLEVVFEYSTDLFEEASIQRLETHLRRVLDHMAGAPNTRIDEFSLLDVVEHEQVVETFNATAQTWEAASLIHQLFESRVERQPDAIALVSEEGQLSYGSLNRRANQLAHTLIAQGIRPDDRVALYVERSAAMVVGLLGILKAGGAYVPVDPDYPPERVSYMLGDSQPRLLLSSEALRGRLPQADVPILWLDDPGALSAQPDHNPDPHELGLRPDHLAYVIYTSGSTGQPKGAMNQHDGVVNRLLWAQQQFALDDSDRVLQKTPYAFDVSVWEFFLPLLAGAQLVLARPGGHKSPTYLAQWMGNTGITVAHFVPSMLQVFLEQDDLSGCRHLRHVLCSGEALPPTLQDRFLQKLPGVALHNLYGPTEAAVDVTYWPCVEPGAMVPIGRPIANTQLYVLDARMQPVPIGVAGELYIGGVQVGRGYLHRPTLTEERFVANPFGAGRLYKTGDLGRWRADGAIEYLGRNDFQVKLRGLRIELGEIEARLLEHPAIREAVVVAREETSGDKRLVAYVVQNQQRRDDDAGWDNSRVEQWRQLYQVEYGKGLDVSFGEDFRTWNSSYDGQPIPLEQMREWRDATVARILALHPRRVLEIGCGSGLVLSQLAPHCESYCGTDLSAEAIARLRVQLEQQAHLAGLVSLHCQPAHGNGNLPSSHFDVIVINSVAQCFPSAEYMLVVLHQAMDLLAPGGAIFLGDIRNLPLLPCLTAAIQLARADASADTASLRSAIERELRLEQELVFDPDFFASLPNRIVGIDGVDIRVKRGHFSNELSRYRYDVVLHKDAMSKEGAPVASRAALPRLYWGKDVMNMASLSLHLQAPSFTGLRLCCVPNCHLADEAAAVRTFGQGQSLDKVLKILRGSDALTLPPHPESLHALGASLGLETIITWSSQHGEEFQQGELDVLFVLPGQRAHTDIYAGSGELRSLDELTTRPVQQENAGQLIASLRESLSGHLPDFMLPSAFVVLDELPLTPNGKLDRQALPAPDRDAAITPRYEDPQGETEQAIAVIWSGLLGLSPIGRHDHFFELGGHSLLATQVAAKLRASLSVDVPLKALFEHPTLAALAEQVQSHASVTADDTGFDLPLVHEERPSSTPASFTQQRLWVIEQLSRGQPVYTMTYAVRLHGELDIPALRASVSDLVARQEGLRTHFVESGGIVLQQVTDASPFDLRVIDLSSDENGTLQTWMNDAAHQSFDLRTQPLIRLALLHEHPRQHVLLISAHHIIADGWSLGIFNRELSTLYNAHRRRRPSPLCELPLQYVDFAHWQRLRYERGAFEREVAYWRERLHDAPAVLPLPTDHPRTVAPSHRGSVLRCVVPASVTRKLKLLVQRVEASLFMGLAAALATLLSRYAGCNDICIGTPVANRQYAALDDVIGFFVNTLVLRIDADGGQSVDALLRQVRDVALDAYAHQEVPFDHVVASLDRARHDLHSPLFQVMLVLQNATVGDLALEHVEAEVLPIHNGTAKFDLTLAVTEIDGELVCEFEYSTDLFERGTIERMARQFERLLQGMATDSTLPVDHLPLLDAAGRRQVIEGFNATDIPYPAETLIHRLFEQQALAHPDAIALLHNGISLSYGELNRRSNCVAHALIELGIGPDDRVAIGMERCIALIVGLLGILKAGGAYVPLDPAYPAERLTYMLHDSAPSALLTQSSLQMRWTANKIPLLLLDEDGVLPGQHPDIHPVVSGLASRHLAYVMYTSGSTGEPKGVMVEHAQVARLLTTTQALFGFTAQDVWTLFHSYAFDFSVWELWGALAYGGRLVIVPSLCARSPKDFYALLCREQVTVLNQTPSAFRALISAQDAQRHRLRYVIFGGEALELHTLLPWIERNQTDQTRLINMYGITETTVHVTYKELTRADIEAGRRSLVGRSLPDLRVYLLDRHGEPVPVGVTGEIYVGGAGVARGYWNRPQLTPERFLPDPFVEDPQARMYKSGDLGRWLPNGEIEYLGRNDFQVKIRGFRIELGEIEAKLSEQANVSDAVVIAREDVPGDKRLVAYLTARDGQSLSVGTLRDALAKQLADYMLPSAFVQLERLPLTANGKLDRQALPAPDQQSVVTREYEAPQGDVERAIATIWQELLGLERVGRHDHFFELGGHSLLAVQMMAKLRSACGVDLPLRTLFDAPTLAMLAAEAGQAQPQALQTGDDIVHQAHDGALPLSFAQQRFWFLDQYQLDNPFYNVALMVSLDGALEHVALRQALQRVIERHDILRTVFPSKSGVPQQVIQADLQLPWRFEDVGEGAQSDACIRAAMMEEAQAPFDLARGPLLRARLLRRHAQSHVLLLTTHHIVYDGWSTRILLDELSDTYIAFKAGTTPVLPELPVDYADYARWEQQRYAGVRMEEDVGYWKAQLKEVPPLLALPTDWPRQALITYRGASHRMHLPNALVQRLTALANERHATVFMALTAITQVWLHRYCGQQDICIGVMSASRPTGTEGLIGNFINILPLTAHIGDTSSFMDLVGAAAKNLLAAYDRQLPFELLLKHVLQDHRSAYTPYAQVVLNFHSELEGVLSAWSTDDALSWQVQANDARETAHAAFDLKLEMIQHSDGLEMVFEYNTDLFDPETIARWSGHYRTLLESACADPFGNTHHLNLLTPAEQHAFASAWRETQADYPRHTTIGELLDLQATRTPDAVAVVHGDRSLSYRELRRRADRLAALLRASGLGPDALVGIFTERSIDMVLAVLAVTKAGAAYVPLDPAYPQARLAHMLSDARPPVVLTQARLASRVEGMAPRIICVDALDLALAEGEIDALPPLGTPADLAYVIYTSGSTGRPKGAMVHRQGFVNLLHWYIRQFDICANDKVLLLSSFSFDLTQKNIFSVLLIGGQLHLPPGEDALDGAGDYIARHGITYLNCAPSAFYPLLADGGVRRLQSLRQVFLGGEPIRVALIHDAYRGLSQVPLIHNTYGPTEASDVVSFHTWDPRIAVSTLPIGRPIANTRLYVLDAHRQLLPQGAVGELYVAGDGVGRGYLQLATLTEDRFLPDPHSDRPGARMYRTGDVVRQLPDGEIEYLGRNDFQVKIRGFRIELGEIEAKLVACAGVREAAVIAREDVPGDKRLVAYLIAHNEQALSIAALRDILAKELADYMLPSAFVQLAQWPLTPNGKLDREALPAPERQSVITREYEAPQGEMEQAIATIWQQLLGLERIGRHDHFFELGGHSLLATQLISRIGAAFKVGLPLRVVFEAPTVAELAARASCSERTQDIAPIPRVGRDQVLPLSFAQQRLWFLDKLESQRGVYNITASVRMTGCLDVEALERTLNEIVQRHDALRTSFVLAGDEPMQVIAPMLPLALEVVDLSDVLQHPAHPLQTRAAAGAEPEEFEAGRETQIRALVRDEASRPFDLASGPLIRFRLLRMAEHEHILQLTMHHIASDGWSMGVVVREFAALYPAFAQGRPSPLRELPIQYADFAYWQRRWLDGDELERQRHYWKQQLHGSPTLLALPTDRPRPAHPSYSGATVPVAVPAALVSELHALGRSTQSTLFMVLCAAFNVLLARHANQMDICIGTPIANRNRADIEDLIGCFVNTLVLRTQVELARDFHTLLQQVHQHTLDAYAHQDVPFEQLVEVLQPERNPSYSPLFQVMLALQNTPMNEFALPGLSMSLVEHEKVTAKFDLSLILMGSQDGLRGYFEYSTDLFDACTIERMAGHFIRLLQAIVTDPSAAVGDLPMLGEAERQQLLYRFNDTVTDIPFNPQALHQLFEAQAARTPDQMALMHVGVPLSYAELNQQANRLAHHLRELGVGPDVLVGICMARTADLIVSMLGVLKAGGAYVPLDPAYPRERIATMLIDAQPSVLLTRQCLREGLPVVAGTTVFCLDAEAALLAGHGGDNLVNVARGTDLAYVIYTSGSTGKPKGVAIQHSNVTTFVHWALATFDSDSTEKVLASTSICFDLSIFEIFVPLSRGGSVWLVDNILAFTEMPDALPVTLINTVPSAIAEVHRSIRLPQSLKVINLAGEALGRGLVQSIYQQSSVERIYNLYGPSEDTTYSTFTLVERDSSAPISIGRPIANTQAYILDARQNPVPIGVTGELFISGDGLARGYLKRPELTAEKFVPNPFSAVPGARMYRTGDLTRYRSSGEIEYLGRVDHQVKIRGFRIELGEIEALLAKQINVRGAAVAAHEDAMGDKRLVAYVTVEDGQPLSMTELRNALAQELPEYMLPGAVMQLEQLPLTPNGKLDRQALPAPDRQAVATREYEAPQGEVEQAVAAVWQELLGLERVGRRDHFFELDGHSLLAVRMITRLRQACHVDIPLAALFKAPELAAFAQLVLSRQVETFLGKDIQAIQQELDSLSEDELLAILGKESDDE
jgi:amino acid adenylation domain-containing protein